MRVIPDAVVTMHYVLKNDNGDVIDQSNEEIRKSQFTDHGILNDIELSI